MTHNEHLHVDNGGYSVSVDEYGNVTIESNFMYSRTAMTLTGYGRNGESALDFLIRSLSDARLLMKLSQEQE
jgi:3',5'-cyclic AMP phosphodiesterase CpdA